ncbi:thiamine phosphate synthase [Rhodopila sp.]|uniref:thiamine phosphate synthase n=1 Tax=Rhodopila sp. TaxID=2480087 RepID=UPI003D0C1F71
MDLKLLAWGLRRRTGGLPRLWLFTDRRRLADPRASVAALPRGRAGVVLRHDDDPARARLGVDLARICRARRLVLVVAGDVRLAAALGAGMHLRGGRWPGVIRRAGVLTSSAHSAEDLRRARAVGADLVFLSPAFATASHPGARGLGPLRWAALVRRMRHGAGRATAVPVIAALGGVDGRSIQRLSSRLVHAAGAIAALSQC